MLNQFLSYFLSNTCVLCNDSTKQAIDLCKPCENDLPWLNITCSICAVPLSGNFKKDLICGNCLKDNPPFKKTYSLWHYEQPVAHLITALKFNHRLVYAKLLGELLASKIKDWYQDDMLPELIIPIPLHKKRLRERGFNQAVEIARPIANKLKIPMDLKNCTRIRATQAQSELHANERHKNIKNAFVVNEKISAKHLAILDDVVTTGHTVSELSNKLRQQGVERIDIWCCARTGLI